MRVGLVADVPHQAVVRGVEDVVQGDGQFDHPEAGAEVPAGLADAVQQVLAQFVSEGDELRLAETAQLDRRIGAVKHRGGGAHPWNLVERRGHQADRY
ncbi:hypothetical protein D3C81_1522010 [compost metagenome]